MSKKLVAGIVVSAFIMIGIPLLSVATVKGDIGFIAVLMMFFVIDPVWCAAAGFFAGRDIKKMWCLPVVTAVLFIVGAWTAFEAGEMDFVRYAFIYLLCGLVFMAVGYSIKSKRNKI